MRCPPRSDDANVGAVRVAPLQGQVGVLAHAAEQREGPLDLRKRSKWPKYGEIGGSDENGKIWETGVMASACSGPKFIQLVKKAMEAYRGHFNLEISGGLPPPNWVEKRPRGRFRRLPDRLARRHVLYGVNRGWRLR